MNVVAGSIVAVKQRRVRVHKGDRLVQLSVFSIFSLLRGISFNT